MDFLTLGMWWEETNEDEIKQDEAPQSIMASVWMVCEPNERKTEITRCCEEGGSEETSDEEGQGTEADSREKEL